MEPHEVSHPRLLLRFIAHRISRKAHPAPSSPALRRRSVSATGLQFTSKQIRRFLAATDGTAIPALHDFRYLPPTAPAVWETALTLELLRRQEFPLPLRGLIHLGGERTYLRTAGARDAFELEVALESIRESRSGSILALTTEFRNEKGYLYAEGRTDLLFRGYHRSRAGAGAGPPEEAPSPGRWQEIARWQLGSTAGLRYAAASGDFNPIHLSRASARIFGFDRPVLHGFCLEAMISHALIERRFAGDVGALRRMSIRFESPVRLPCSTVLRVADRGGSGADFRVDGGEAGERPFATGSFVGGIVQG